MDRVLNDLAMAAGEALRQANQQPITTTSEVWGFLRGEKFPNPPGVALAKLTHALEAHNDFAPFMQGVLVGRTWDRVNPVRVAAAIALAAYRKKDLGQFFQKIISFMGSKSSGTSTYVAVVGCAVPPPGELKLSETISVVQPYKICDGDEKARSIPHALHYQDAPQPRASAFIKITSPSKRVLYDSFSDIPISPEFGPNTDAIKTAIDVVSCAIAIDARTHALMAVWSEFDALEELNLGFGFDFVRNPYSEGLYENAVVNAGAHAAFLNLETFPQFYGKWMAMPPSVKSALSVALLRLNRGVRGWEAVDRALDLGIALEILLLHGSKGSGELSYRFSLHGANFFGGTDNERYERFKFWKAFYSLRSRAAHEGALTNELGVHNTVLDVAGKNCAAIARSIIERGGFPDWEKDYVFKSFQNSTDAEALWN